MKENPSMTFRINADMSGFAEALRKVGEACRLASEAIVNALKPAFRDYLYALVREMRTQTGPWYSRWYWRAAYASADRFPAWITAD